MKRMILLVLIFIISQFSEAQNGTVNSYVKISQTQPGFPITLWNGAQFGNAVTSIGDLDNNGIPDLAITSVDGMYDGKLYITFLDSGGIVNSMVEIKQGLFGLPTSQTYDMDWFGHSIDTIGDLNQDGVVDLIVGLPYIVGGNPPSTRKYR